ncbi:hypothetical protein PybrP1_001929 [[Pythium] brassicae (nom. inval.)]|nr:hypothetical protein PybrP1_001929 [[Pythium] brassicae (nom. inval.)]
MLAKPSAAGAGDAGGGGAVRPRSGSSRPPASASGSKALSSRASKKSSGDSDKGRVVGERYQLGAEIGRGGFGVVFAALDLRNGRSVAIKQVALHDIDKDELLSIESEISLLKKLKHENIVKYHDTIRTQSFLYIVLEYMENGSLAQFMKRFGALSETLVAIETQKSNSVVGSPYWMAPEVIEMAGWSFASDIWSVGCTIIELLSTKPPYFDLAPMAALFRIVQDDHPPLPERISPALHDFIMKCFMKEPRLRSSADELLVHPWIAQIPKTKVEQSSQLVAENVSSRNDRDALLNTIKLYEKEKHTAAPEASSASPSELPIDDDDDGDDENWDDELGLDSAPKPLSLGSEPRALRPPATRAPSSSVAPRFQLSKEDERALFDEGVWDDEPPSAAQLPEQGVVLSAPSSRQSPSPGSAVPSPPLLATTSWDRSALVPSERRLTKLQSFSEKGLDEAFDFDEADEERLVKAVTRKSSVSVVVVGGVLDGASGTALSPLDEFNEDDDTGFDDMLDAVDGPVHRLSRRDLKSAADSTEAFADFEDELGFDSLRDSNQMATARVVELLALLDPSMDDQVILDACTSLQEIFESNQALRRDLMSQAGVVPNIMEALEMKRMDVLHAVLRVVNMIVEDNQKFQENLALVGLIPVVIRLTQRDFAAAALDERLSGGVSTSDLRSAAMVRLEAAKFVRQSCKTSSLTLQMFIACGGLPVLVDFLPLAADRAAPISDSGLGLLRIALEGISSVFSLQTIPKNDICRLFVKAGLLRKFVVVFNEIVRAVRAQEEADDNDDGNDDAPRHAASPAATWTIAELHATCDIFLLFSQGDAVVKEHMCDPAVLDGLLRALAPTRADAARPVRASDAFIAAMVKVLKCVKNLSMEPMTLDMLDRAGAIPTLVYLLNEQEAAGGGGSSDAKRKEVENIVLLTMFYLCRINRNRQTHAAQAGVIPSLMKVVRDASPPKQFALPILCDLAHASPTARAHLWACDGVSLFLALLDDKYWQLDAFKSISTWLVHDTVRMESVLLVPANLLKLVQCFRSAQDTELENLLEPLIEMITRSVRMNQSLGRNGLFVAEILTRLRRVPKAIVRKNLLKMLKSLFESHTSPTQFLAEYDLHPTIYALAQDENSLILVKEIASQLLQAILVAAAVF